MKLAVMSDLHFEFYDDDDQLWKYLDEEFQYPVNYPVVLAGDIASASKIVKNLSKFLDRYSEVIYVPGNHEYYGKSTASAQQYLEDLSFPRLNVLRPGKVAVVNGQRFVGATLWFSAEEPEPSYDGRLHREVFNDFTAIKDFQPWVYQQNKLAREWLTSTVTSDDIVVTHHLPSMSAVHPRFSGSRLNRYFVTEMDDVIVSKNPRLWVCGHTHAPVDVMVAQTRVYANPRGYPREYSNPMFFERIVVEL